jgi:hypothetical protein
MYAQKPLAASFVQEATNACKIWQQTPIWHNTTIRLPRWQLHPKNLLHLHHQHNQETYIILADLVKAYDTYNHKLMIEILECYGALPKLRDSIRQLYADLKIMVKIGKEKVKINQEVGVQQDNNISSVTFLFLMSAFAEMLEQKWRMSSITETEFTMSQK